MTEADSILEKAADVWMDIEFECCKGLPWFLLRLYLVAQSITWLTRHSTCLLTLNMPEP